MIRAAVEQWFRDRGFLRVLAGGFEHPHGMTVMHCFDATISFVVESETALLVCFSRQDEPGVRGTCDLADPDCFRDLETWLGECDVPRALVRQSG